MTISEVPKSEKIENTILYLNNNGMGTLRANLFKQELYLKRFLEVKLTQKEQESINSVEEKWIYFFKATEDHEKKCQLMKLCEYLFVIPTHNTTVERNCH